MIVEDTGGLYSYLTNATILRVTFKGVIMESLQTAEFQAVFEGNVVQNVVRLAHPGVELFAFGSLQAAASKEGFSKAIFLQGLSFLIDAFFGFTQPTPYSCSLVEWCPADLD